MTNCVALMLLAGLAVIGSDCDDLDPNRSIPGPQAEAWFGSSLSWGKGDHVRFIVGAPVSDPMAGQRPGNAFVFEVDSDKPLFILTGEADGDRFGSSVAGLGDVTGDGFAEWLVGAPGSDANGVDAGRAYLLSGNTGELLHTFNGSAEGDWFGFSVAHVGDVNGDGVGDFAIGARQPSGLGYVRVYCGSTFELVHELEGEEDATHFGFAVAGGGDVNGDGVDDVIVSAPFHHGPGFFGGRAYVYSGQSGSLLYTFSAEAGFNYFGTSVAILGDVNGDGHADVAIGADGFSAPGGNGANVGRVYIYSGADGSLLHVLTGTVQRGRLGRGISAVGDYNGDGRADVLIGQPSPVAVGGNGIGRAFVFSGANGSVLCEFVSDEFDDYFGFVVSGRSNRHGFGAGLLIGAFGSDVNGTQSGRADVYAPSPGVPGDLNGDGVVDVSDLLVLLGQWGDCPTGEPCTADVNGDGVIDVSDLLVLLANWGY